MWALVGDNLMCVQDLRVSFTNAQKCKMHDTTYGFVQYQSNKEVGNALADPVQL